MACYTHCAPLERKYARWPPGPIKLGFKAVTKNAMHLKISIALIIHSLDLTPGLWRKTTGAVTDKFSNKL